jgi:peptide/nickel transport system substrate-binding protein
MHMTPLLKRACALAAAAMAAGTLAACGNPSGGSNPPASGAGKPVYGGTLTYVAAGDVDHLDPLSAYYLPSAILELAWTRQLVSYPPSNNYQKSISIAADAATEIPTAANGGITDNGTVYTFHIRPGVMWNTSPARQVTSQDFEREFLAMCNPVQPVGNPLYYTQTIKGMSEYCSEYQAAFVHTTPTPANLTAFQTGHSISGISTPNPMTIQFKLNAPAYDFLNILAMPFASARPAEYDQYLPDSAQFRQHTISDGPYQISQYIALKKIVLTRNPAWKQSSDPLRHQYLGQVVVDEGVTSNETQLAGVESGTYDLQWDTVVPTPSIPSLEANPSSGLHIYDNSGAANPFLWLNEQSPDADHAMGKVLVRQAIEYAINKVAIAKIYGGVKLNPVMNAAVAPGNAGYANFNDYPTPGNEGSPGKCKQLLTEAGYPHGLTLYEVYRNAGNHPAVFTSDQASLKACGITDIGVPMSQGPYYDFLSNQPNSAKPKQWDITAAGWSPDWLGDSNARSNIVPLFQANCTFGSPNYGCIDSPTVNSDIAKALSAPSAAAAQSYWVGANKAVMAGANIVPISTQDIVLLAGSKVHNLVYSPFTEQWLITQMWVSQ